MASSFLLSPSTQFISSPKFAFTPTPVPPPGSVTFRHSPRISASYATTAERTASSSNIVSQSSMYEILGINMGATCQEIKAAYRRLARVSHPDVASKDRNDSSADEFIRIHAAYATLSDPGKRAVYDRTLLLQQRWPASTGIRATSTSSRFSVYTGRRWETDQCW